ncbi:MAG TPA: ISAzo13 family transposase [Streptosporangiaceae bacterium]|nr:ISAzo13 family transposase [Streptosporangiaceae bacterium]
MDAGVGFLGQLGPSLLKVLPLLDERSRRLVLGMAAEAEGQGGTGRVAALTGASWQTVANGKAGLDAEEELPPGRQRRPGGGRRALAETDPGLAPALEKLIRDAMRGDPESPLVWTTRSAEHLAAELAAAGHPCSGSTAWRMLRRMGFTQQPDSRAREGRQHPERDGQFRHIAARSREYLESGDPVISVDSRKRELAGNFGQDGRERAPAGDPVTVRSHDFPGRDQQHAIPYGIYDEKANAGFVNVGTDGNTAALAVESVRRWWRAVGRDAYPDASRLLVTCDSGGSGGCASKAWKAGLAALAQETGLDIEVCHFPPGTSKWNRIGHRLFCQISLAWRARPLTSYDVIIDTIGRVTTKTGLTAIAVLDENPCPTGTEIAAGQMRDIEERCLIRGGWHGEWNYTLLAHPAAPEPAPDPEPPDRARHEALNHPALTGLQPGDLKALAAALEVPFDADREQKYHLRRGRRRVNAVRRAGPHGNLRTDVTGHVLILRLRDHLRLPHKAAAVLFGIHPASVSRAAVLTRRLIDDNAITVPASADPPPGPVRTIDDLREYAAQHGIEMIIPPTGPTVPQKPH